MESNANKFVLRRVVSFSLVKASSKLTLPGDSSSLKDSSSEGIVMICPAFISKGLISSEFFFTSEDS